MALSLFASRKGEIGKMHAEKSRRTLVSYVSRESDSRHRQAGVRAMSTPFPPTIIVRHPNENPRKCSVLPLRDREDLRFLNYPVKEHPCLEGYIRLAAEGPELSSA